MSRQINIEPITDKIKIESAVSLVANLIESPYHLKLSFIRSRNWAVIPVSSGSHFIPEDAELLSQALHAIDCFECLAVATESLLNPEEMCYWISTTQEGLFEFGKKLGYLNFALISEDVSFVVLCTVEDYYLVAGQVDFVTRAVGKNLRAAREDFFEYANDHAWPNYMRELLLSVYKRYEPFNGK